MCFCLTVVQSACSIRLAQYVAENCRMRTHRLSSLCQNLRLHLPMSRHGSVITARDLPPPWLPKTHSIQLVRQATFALTGFCAHTCCCCCCCCAGVIIQVGQRLSLDVHWNAADFKSVWSILWTCRRIARLLRTFAPPGLTAYLLRPREFAIVIIKSNCCMYLIGAGSMLDRAARWQQWASTGRQHCRPCSVRK